MFQHLVPEKVGQNIKWESERVLIINYRPGDVCWVSRDEQLFNSQPVGHVIVLASPAPEHVRETVHKLGFQ